LELSSVTDGISEVAGLSVGERIAGPLQSSLHFVTVALEQNTLSAAQRLGPNPIG
jgi:hypothetical protein